MESDDARILVIGAGVNGSIIAERLLQRGVDVTVLARGKRLTEIESNGIVIENPCIARKSQSTIDPHALKNPRPAGAESTLTENASSP